MVQKSRKPADTPDIVHAKAADPADETKRPRGRPRAYDANEALTRARNTFWVHGFSGTSLDELSAATGMNRPSLYGAFGDKRALYLATIDRYVEMSRQGMDRALAGDRPLKQALLHVFDLALSMYFPPDSTSQGCFLIGTAAVESVTDEDVRSRLAEGLRTFDRSFEARFRRAQQEGEIDGAADPAMLARLASAVLHSLALRSRAGDKRATLRATAEAGIDMLCANAARATEPDMATAQTLAPPSSNQTRNKSAKKTSRH